MLRNVIGSPIVTEIYKNGATDLKRGMVVTKNLTTDVAEKATGAGVDVWIAYADNQPTGHLADVEVSAYDTTMDTIPASTYLVLNKYPVGAQFATDQIDGTLAEGDYLIAGGTGKEGLFVKAVATDVTTFKCLGTYDDAGHALTLVEVINPHTVA